MSDNCPVRTPPPPLHSPGEVEALIFPDLHRTKNGHNDASGAPSTATTSTTTTRESTASSFTTPNPSSRTTSAEPTESPTTSSSTEPPFSPPSSALVPRCSSPIPIPARLRRKCPLYTQQFEGEKEKEKEEDHDDDAFATSVTGKKKVIVVGATKKTEPARTSKEQEEEEEEDATAGAAATGSLSPVVPSSPELSIERRTTPRKRILTPVVPVPHLIKKSRGRRVPEPDQARERTHVCAVPGCSKSFARAEHLKRHVISLHTHEKPFVCRCGKTFARRDNLLQHQRVHAT